MAIFNVNEIQYYDISDNNRASPADPNHDEKVERSKSLVAHENINVDLRIQDISKYTSKYTAFQLRQQEQAFLENAPARSKSQRQSDRAEAERELCTRKQSYRPEAEQDIHKIETRVKNMAESRHRDILLQHKEQQAAYRTNTEKAPNCRSKTSNEKHPT